MRANPQRKKRRAPSARASRSQFTLAFAPSAARLFAKAARLPKALRRQMLRGLRKHPRGGVYVAAPGWQGSKNQAQTVAQRARMVIAFAAGRGRKSFGKASAVRVVASP